MHLGERSLKRKQHCKSLITLLRNFRMIYEKKVKVNIRIVYMTVDSLY